MRGKLMTLAMALALVGAMAQGAEGKSKPGEMKHMTKLTTEQREKMASAHEQMASCLRSDKTPMACHEEMMKGMGDMMGEDGCPMMMGIGEGHGKHHEMMETESQEVEK